MSNIIPMVSSSPPPMDEGGGFDWDDDDDFGTFASATDSSFAKSEETGGQDSAIKSIPVSNHVDKGPSNDEFGDFADFDSQNTDAVHNLSMNHNSVKQSDHRPECINLTQEPKIEVGDSSGNERNDYQSTNGPLVDSGVYSSNVSPVQHVECSGSETGQVINKEGIGEVIRNETSEVVSSAQSDADLASVTQENTVNEDSKVSDDIEFSENPIKCIPPKNIPIDESVLKSGTEAEDFVVSENESSNVVISNCDESNLEKSGSPTSKSSENENGNSVTNANSQKFDLSETVEQSSIDEEITDAGDNIDIPPEKSSELQELSSIGHSEVTENSTELTDQEEDAPSHNLPDTSAVCSIEATKEESEDTGNNVCSDSSLEEECAQKKTDNFEANSENTIDTQVNNSTELTGDNSEELKGEEQQDSVKPDQNETHDSNTQSVEEIDERGLEKDAENNVSENSECDSESFTAVSDSVKPSESEDLAKTNDEHLPVNVTDTKETKFNDSQENSDNEASDSQAVDSNEKDNDDFDDFSETNVNDGEEFGDFNANFDTLKDTKNNDKEAAEDDDFGDFNANVDTPKEPENTTEDKTENDDDDFGDFNASTGDLQGVSEKKDDNEDNFGDFSTSEIVNKEQSGDDFGDFNATFDDVPTATEGTGNDWAAFSEPQIAATSATDDDDDWAGFEDDEANSGQQFEDTSTEMADDGNIPVPDLSHMNKHEKLIYAVTTCFPALVTNFEISDQEKDGMDELHTNSDTQVWGKVKGQNTTDALTYQWTKSLWNTQLFTTLHIDTRNILIGHKKAPVPVYAAGLTLLEPTKGQELLKPEVLVDTSKAETTSSSTSQDSIPAAQFDWSSSGLTNPLEANNKTLNLDFLIQDQATKSNALESEFLSTNESPVHKPAIQPLENILANLKTSSTYRPTNQNEDISPEASKVVKSLPDLVFMKSKVLMFPVKLGGFQD